MIRLNNIYIVGLLSISNMDKKKRSKIATLNYFKSREGKRQCRVSIPPKFVEELGWKPKEKLKVWIFKEKKQIRIKKLSAD